MKYNFLRPKYEVELKRLGSLNDGGYLIPKEAISKTQTLLSFGLGDNWSFEKSFKENNLKLKIFSFDHTVNRKFWYEYTILSFFHFLKSFKNFKKIFKFLSYKIFFNKKNKIFHVKKRIVKKKYYGNETSIDDLSNQFKEKVFIKIDIENDEYRILESLKNFKKILGFVIEFHYVDLNYRLIKKFLKNNNRFKIVHVHANNMGGIDVEGKPSTLEITFINKNIIKKYKFSKKKEFNKNKFDNPNDPERKDLILK